MATEYHLITQNGTAGSYWAGLSTEQKDRYYWGGAYRVYSGMFAWETGMSARRNLKTELVVECEGAWIDSASGYNANHSLAGYYSITFTSKIDGVYGSGFHVGTIGAGYVRSDNSNSYTLYSTDTIYFVDGIEVRNTKSTGALAGISLSVVGSKATKCIAQTTGGYAIGCDTSAGQGHEISNCKAHSSPVGFRLPSYAGSCLWHNNTAVGNTTGFNGTNSYSNTVINNIAYNNTTNWGTAPSGGYWNNNAGLTGEAWTSSGSTRVVVSSSDFVNTAGGDYRPSGDSVAHTSSSLLVDVASQEFSKMVAVDIAGNPRPSYKNGDPTNWDIGAYEFDWGYGLAPASCTLTISAPVSLVGAEIRIYDNDNTPAGSFGTELAGTESHTASTYTYTGLQGNSIVIQIMLTGYEEFLQTYTVPDISIIDFYARMTPETNA